MSYISLDLSEKEQGRLEEKEKNLRAAIRLIVGSKKFFFSNSFLKRYQPTIGVGGMTINAVTKKYVYVGCFMQMGFNESNTEYGAFIKKYPICYQRGSGSFVDKVELDDLFISDLEKLLNELKYYLWWEAEVNFPTILAEYNRAQPFVKRYADMVKALGYDPNTNKNKE